MNLKKILLAGSLVLLMVAIPLTVYVSQQQQQTQTLAQKSTTLCFTETPATTSTATPTCATGALSKKAGDTFSVDVVMNPGTNQVSTVRLNITYDATKLTIPPAGLTPNPSVVTPLTETTYTTGGATARLGIVVNPSAGVDPTKALSQITKIATIQFKVADTATTGTTPLAFGQTLVLSANPADGQDEDVLSSATPLSITIGAGTGAPAGTNVPPSCTALNVDRTTSGTSPFSITFTANGRDTDGTIPKVTFDFGDGPVQDVVSGGGIGTNSVSSQLAHTYNNPGSFIAKAILTDSSNAISTASASCSQTITVTKGVGGTATSSATPTQTQTATSTSTPTVSVEDLDNTPPGPSEWILGTGVMGVIVSLVGGYLLFGL